ncbi:MAG: tetratricopeptide repeat protein [Undibacterium sp.]|nr:tetratricopeptide repeat protein [Opitutaceae bacterium]
MPPHRPPPPARFSRWLAPLALVAAVMLAYANSLGAPFLFDDRGAVLTNPTIRSLASLAVFNPPADGSTTTGRPLVNVSYALNHAISAENVWSYHTLNIAIHACAALALLGLLRRTFSSLQLKLPAFDCAAAALAAAALWALHPLQTETVVCIAQRTESLCGLFYLLTLYAFARATIPSEGGARSSPRAWLVLSVVSCLLGMATKEVTVTAPLLVLLYDRTFVAGTFAAALRPRRGYYVALAATWLLLAFLVLQNSGARGVSAGFGLGVTPWSYLLTQADALVLYLRLSLWPHPLVLDYGTAVATSIAAVWWQGLVVLALLAATVWALVRKPVLGFAGAWFFLILAPSSSIVPLVTQTVAEHRMYLPLAAVVTVACFGLVRWTGKRAPWLLAPLVLAAGLAAAVRNHDYRDPIALWSDTIAHAPAHSRAFTHLGAALVAANRPAEALPPLDRAVALNPADYSAQRNRALALLALGRAPAAAVIFAALPAREPGEAAEYFDLGNAFARDGKYPEAAAAYTRTVTLDPTHFAARANLGNALLGAGRAAEAITTYEAALRLRPGDARLLENLAFARESLPN